MIRRLLPESMVASGPGTMLLVNHGIWEVAYVAGKAAISVGQKLETGGSTSPLVRVESN